MLIEDGKPDDLCIAAAEDLQHYLRTQNDWEHNFGLKPEQNGTVVGKMFGVLVVKTHTGDLGYLAAFSGKLGGQNHHRRFVPPIYDLLEEGGFFNAGMQELNKIIDDIKMLEAADQNMFQPQIRALKTQRKAHSVALQQKIFDQYRFVNKAGKERDLRDLFCLPQHKNPPAGAGECAGPKLLQYAFQHKMQPIALAEFWWGQSPKSANWKHREYYACCKEKCAPILGFMLGA